MKLPVSVKQDDLVVPELLVAPTESRNRSCQQLIITVGIKLRQLCSFAFQERKISLQACMQLMNKLVERLVPRAHDGQAVRCCEPALCVSDGSSCARHHQELRQEPFLLVQPTVDELLCILNKTQ